MSKHTPGPWKAQLRDGYGGQWEVERQWEVVATGETERWIADADSLTGCDEANARLIAAAPELLEALQEIAECGSASMVANVWVELARVQNIARAAIAKATGEDQ